MLNVIICTIKTIRQAKTLRIFFATKSFLDLLLDFWIIFFWYFLSVTYFTQKSVVNFIGLQFVFVTRYIILYQDLYLSVYKLLVYSNINSYCHPKYWWLAISCYTFYQTSKTSGHVIAFLITNSYLKEKKKEDKLHTGLKTALEIPPLYTHEDLLYWTVLSNINCKIKICLNIRS